MNAGDFSRSNIDPKQILAGQEANLAGVERRREKTLASRRSQAREVDPEYAAIGAIIEASVDEVMCCETCTRVTATLSEEVGARVRAWAKDRYGFEGL